MSRPTSAMAATPQSLPAGESRRPPIYPRWVSPLHLRRRQLRSGWRCELTPHQRQIKVLLDVALCAVLGLPAAVLILFAAIAIWLESGGSVFYCQQRVGSNGRVFRMWKLRTMVQNAEAMESQLRHLSEVPWPDFKIARDPRITHVGAFLRRTSIDELPQIWNVIRGEMSWIGPRPTNFGLRDYELWHTERLAVLPGITGLWQVLERAACDFDHRLRLDLAYIRTWRLRLDLTILAMTVSVVLSGKGGK